jgi:hypothetical protein
MWMLPRQLIQNEQHNGKARVRRDEQQEKWEIRLKMLLHHPEGKDDFEGRPKYPKSIRQGMQKVHKGYRAPI